MEIKCAHSEVVGIETLVPNPKNPNKHPDDQIKLLAKIMKHQGWRSPIVVSNRSGFVIKGHGRMMAAQLNGWDTVPIDRQDYLNEADEYADMVADNKIAELSETDLAMVNRDVMDLGPDFDLDLLGIPDFCIEPIDKLDPQCDEDDVPDNSPTRVKHGDIWSLGKHRLMCGDSTMIDDVEKLMCGEKADMVFTDPPYGIALDTDYTGLKSERTANKFERTANKFERIIGDENEFDPNFLLGLFEYCTEIFLFGANYYAEKIHNKNAGSWIVWDKRVSETLDLMYGSAFELCWSKTPHKQDIARVTWAGCFGHNKTDDGAQKVHPTMKPVKLIEWFFDRHKGINVIDMYGGSGSTLIACEKTNRKCFMMELSEKYCDVILARWEKYTGKKAELINGET